MSTGCFVQTDADGKTIEKYNLVTGHAYTTLGTNTYTNKSTGKITRLVKMRNPWGSEKYTGPWSDNSAEMTEDAKQQLNHTTGNDGTFFVTVEDYKVFFNGVVSLFYGDDWKRTNMMGSWDRTQPTTSIKGFTFNNTQTQRVSVQISTP
jgi:hypothetical protein